jgi:hypothetical protein
MGFDDASTFFFHREDVSRGEASRLVSGLRSLQEGGIHRPVLECRLALLSGSESQCPLDLIKQVRYVGWSQPTD